MTEEAMTELKDGLNRRDILKAGFAGMLGVLPILALAPVAEARSYALPDTGTFGITFRNQHTGEGFSGVYRVGNKYLPEAFDEINTILRDFRTGDVFPVDPRVVDIMYMLRRKTDKNNVVLEVLSGYRSPRTNDRLRRATEGVANHSLHLTGQAVDLRMPGYSTRKLRDVAVRLRAGGVGYYADSNFVHVDTGKVRTW